jgi:hypothetical protein
VSTARHAALLAVALWGCGGWVVPIGAESNDGGTSAPPARDASRDRGVDGGRDAGLPVSPPHDAGTPIGPDASKDAPAACPVSAPQSGVSCAPIDASCSYPTDGSACIETFVCGSSGWAREAPATSCKPGSCATSYATVEADASCAPEGEVCGYAQGTCTCAPPIGPIVAGSKVHWQCFPKQPGCPSPQPAVGSPCGDAAANTSCNYGACADGVELQCTGGVWVKEPVGCPL